MRLLVFLDSGILEDGSVALFHVNFFFETFGFRHFGRNFSVIFHMN